MNLFINRQKQVESLFDEYCQAVTDCMDRFQETMAAFCKEPDREQLGQNVVKVHQAESHADDLRRDIETLLYAKALFPESRGDLLGLLEAVDRVPNGAESAVRLIYNQHIPLPAELAPRLLELVVLDCRSSRVMLDSVRKLFNDFTSATVNIGVIDELESEADALQAILTEQVFSNDATEGFIKLLLRDLITHVGRITDRVEAVGDRIRILVTKRSL